MDFVGKDIKQISMVTLNAQVRVTHSAQYRVTHSAQQVNETAGLQKEP
jgi:hypothetical protein